MPDTEFIRAMNEMGDRFEEGLNRVHSRIDKVGTDTLSIGTQTQVFAERLANHIDRHDIHQPIPPAPQACEKSNQVERKLDTHVEDHPKIVKQDIAGTIGMVIVGAILAGLGTYVAHAVLGGG